MIFHILGFDKVGCVLTEKTISGSSCGTERIVRGLKGSFIRKHQNPHPGKQKIDWVQVFTDKYCGGSVDEYERVRSGSICARKHCQLCLKPKEIQINQFSGPLLLAMNIYACSNRTNQNPNVPYAPEELHLADTAYALSACIYGDGGHET